ncbi:Astrotactin-2 [Microtus ochrogaster]|uniref:Astrotactin-2 n=1 Tax=Microtus ochrogaster TaxID=79684 RepID=A0A8J6GS45_MICOH|nr:Astrotactin-2 [Microtus ochrogaster]
MQICDIFISSLFPGNFFFIKACTRDLIFFYLLPGEFLSFADDLLSGLGTSCVAAGRSHGEIPEVSIYSVIFKCLEPDGLYKFTLYAVDTRGRHSELSTVTLRTACPLVDDNKAEEIADKIYNLYNGYTSGKEQQTAYNTLMEVSASMLFRVQHHYNSHYEKFGDFVWRSEDELGPRKAHLILRRLERVSSHCSSLLRSAYIQSRVDTIPYLFCRSEEVRPAGMVWYSILKDTKITCEEKMVSMARNTYGETKGRLHIPMVVPLRQVLAVLLDVCFSLCCDILERTLLCVFSSQDKASVILVDTLITNPQASVIPEDMLITNPHASVILVDMLITNPRTV